MTFVSVVYSCCGGGGHIFVKIKSRNVMQDDICTLVAQKEWGKKGSEHLLWGIRLCLHYCVWLMVCSLFGELCTLVLYLIDDNFVLSLFHGNMFPLRVSTTMNSSS